jgi:hypothetical protein
MLEIDSELNTNIGVYKILHRLTKNENFSGYKQGFMNFMLMTVVLSDSESCHEQVFAVHILLVNLCEQAYEYVLMRTQLFRWSDRHISHPTVLTRLVVVIYHRHRP